MDFKVSEWQEELLFWEAWLKSEGMDHPEYFQFGLDPKSALQDEFKELLDPHQHTFSILDVGSGPLTRVGKIWQGHDILLYLVDPLADEYMELIQSLHITAPIKLIKGFAGQLGTMFGLHFFDLAVASNSLDHSAAPMLAIEQMLLVTKPLHFVRLSHRVNEGLRNNYNGLHQWDFDFVDDSFVIKDRHGTLINVNQSLVNGRVIECNYSNDRAWINVLIQVV